MKYVLFLIAILFSSQAVALNCEKQPTCEELNYSKEDDPQCAEDGYILCPFDFSYKKCLQPDCEKLGFTSSEKSGWCSEIITCPQDSSYTACNCLKSRCNIGDVFYADGSCGDVKDYTEEKVAVGVVYYTNCDGGGKVISLKDLTLDSNYVFHPTEPFGNTALYKFPWGLSGVTVPGLKYKWATNEQFLLALQTRDPDFFNGEKDTQTLINFKKDSCSYDEGTKEYAEYCVATAALAAHQFYPLGVEPNNTIVGAGRWYLPSLGELTELYGYDYDQVTTWDTGKTGKTKEKVTQTLTTLEGKAEPLKNIEYWASIEYSGDIAYELKADGSISKYYKKDPHCAVRASLNFR